MKITPGQLELVKPYLAGERAQERGEDGHAEYDMYCPLHDDHKRSATLDVDNGLFYCHAGCGGSTVKKLVERQSEWVSPEGRTKAVPSRRRAPSPTGSPEERVVEEANRGLLANPLRLDELAVTRGLWASTVQMYKLGWEEGHYTIPIYDSRGLLLNIRKYTPNPKNGRRKMWGVKGHNLPKLYPVQVLKQNEIILCEGEFDALITNQFGFPALTRTSSAGSWRAQWSHLFKNKTVYLCHDCDLAGQAGNIKVGRALRRYADVRVLRLPYPVEAKHGKDLTDWWLEHDGDKEAFNRLLEEAADFDPDVEEPELADAAVVDAFDAENVGRPLRLTVTVKGRREPGYSIPRDVQFRCDQSQGKKCEVCPMHHEWNGEHDARVQSRDPIVLALIDATHVQARDAIRSKAGIVKCPALDVQIASHQAIEILYARPSIESSNGRAADYKNIKLTSVGRHDTPANNTVQVVGALHTDPRSHRNEFQVWDVAKTETSIDRFDMDREKYELLKRFRPRPDQSPLQKLWVISRNISEHVTQIYGRPHMHVLMDLVYHSASAFEFEGKIIRGWLDALVVGDTRTGKSEAARRVSDYFDAGEVVSCESASFAGIVGGLQQFGAQKEWAVTWGSIPINDRRLVVLDEAGGLDPEQISQMSDIRSSGIAMLIKIHQERTYARTRLLWLANPRNAKMSDYTYGAQAIKPLIGNPEDIARFDLAMSVASGDLDPSTFKRGPGEGRTNRYTQEACSQLVRWAWSRTSEQIQFGTGVEEAIRRSALALGGRYVEDPPLIQAANAREKVARIAVAIAMRTFSCDEQGEIVQVTKKHVDSAVKYVDQVYGLQSFGYAELSRRSIDQGKEAEKFVGECKRFLRNHKDLIHFLRSAYSFRRQDVEEALGVETEEANGVVNSLMKMRMIRKERGDIKIQPTLNRILREVEG